MTRWQSTVLRGALAVVFFGVPHAHGAMEPLALPHEIMNADGGGGWFARPGVSHTLEGIPVGEAELGEIPWFISDTRAQGYPDALMLKGTGASTSLSELKGIAVNRMADRIYFLHTFNPGPGVYAWEKEVQDLLDPFDTVRSEPEQLPPFPPTLFRYVLRYDDGDSVSVGVRWNESVFDWYPAGTMLPPMFADTAWVFRKHNRWVKRSRYPQQGEQTAVYKFELVNPKPSKMIASIDMISANDQSHDFGAPALLAITTERLDSAAPVYFVAPDGDDENEGTFDAPWATLKRVSHWGVTVLEPGVRVYLRGGTYRPTDNRKITTKSTAENWTLISSWPGETPVIDGTDIHKSASDDGLLLFIKDGFLTVQGLWLTNSRMSGLRAASWADITNLVYRNNVVFKSWGPGLWPSKNSKVLGNWIIRACDSDMYTDTLTWEFVPKPTGKPGAREQLELGSLDNVEAAFNWICWGDKEGVDINGGNGKWIHHNHLHDMYAIPWATAFLLNSYNPSWGNVVIEHNIAHHTAMGVNIGSEGAQPLGDVTVRYNVFFDNVWRGIFVGGFGEGVRVYNNTCVSNNQTGLGIGYGLRGHDWPKEDTTRYIRNVDFRNNLSANNKSAGISCGFDDYRGKNISFGYNLEYPCPEKNKWGNTLFYGDNPVCGEPRFEDGAARDFRLRPGSAAIDAGDPSAAFSDPDGSRADLGAYVTGVGSLAAISRRNPAKGSIGRKLKESRNEVKFYSINGRRISGNVDRSRPLPRGVYVRIEGRRAKRALIMVGIPGTR